LDDSLIHTLNTILSSQSCLGQQQAPVGGTGCMEILNDNCNVNDNVNDRHQCKECAENWGTGGTGDCTKKDIKNYCHRFDAVEGGTVVQQQPPQDLSSTPCTSGKPYLTAVAEMNNQCQGQCKSKDPVENDTCATKFNDFLIDCSSVISSYPEATKQHIHGIKADCDKIHKTHVVPSTSVDPPVVPGSKGPRPGSTDTPVPAPLGISHHHICGDCGAGDCDPLKGHCICPHGTTNDPPGLSNPCVSTLVAAGRGGGGGGW